MLKAVALGTLAQSALLLSGLLVYWIHFPPRFDHPELLRRGPNFLRPSLPPSISRSKGGRPVGSRACGHRSWCSVAFASGLGYVLADTISGVAGDRMAALAGGGLLAMLTDSLMPFAFDRGGQLAGVGTVLGFCNSLMF
jgi:hypothetical protein